MKVTNVDLPPEELIRPHDLAAAIGKAICPVKTEGLTGMECIDGKRVPMTVPNPRLQGFPDLALGSKDDVWNVQMSFHLTDKDREALEPLLNHLPPLTYPMKACDISLFEEAYQALSQRPSWMPRLLTADTINRRLSQQSSAIESHFEEIMRKIQEGSLFACNEMRLHTRTFFAGPMIPRSSAIEYVKLLGLSVRNDVHSDVDAAATEQGREEGIFTASNVRVGRKANNDPYTTDELIAIEKFVTEENPMTGKKLNTNRRAAELIGVHPSRISQLLKELTKRQEQEQKAHSSLLTTTLDQISRSKK